MKATEDKTTTKYYVVMRLEKWSDFEIKQQAMLPKIELLPPIGLGIGFIPVFGSWEDALEYAGDGDIIKTIREGTNGS